MHRKKRSGKPCNYRDLAHALNPHQVRYSFLVLGSDQPWCSHMGKLYSMALADSEKERNDRGRAERGIRR